jgi:hypothetical protein
MAKPQPIALDGDDLSPARARFQTAARQRGVVPSADLVPLQFRMSPSFVRAFKQAALDRDMKLNELLNWCFDESMKSAK